MYLLLKPDKTTMYRFQFGITQYPHYATYTGSYKPFHIHRDMQNR